MKALRGQILDFLKRVYPREIEELSIISVFYQYHQDKDIKQALHYLADKGYIEKKEIPHPYQRRRLIMLYKLTPKGIDLLENTIADDGIILPTEDEQ